MRRHSRENCERRCGVKAYDGSERHKTEIRRRIEAMSAQLDVTRQVLGKQSQLDLRSMASKMAVVGSPPVLFRIQRQLEGNGLASSDWCHV